jgi:phosphomannomutase
MTAPLQAVFKAYDIRGTVPEQLDEPLLYAVGVAFARFVREDGGERVVVARDMRTSGPPLARALVAGVTSAGLQVTDLGLASTDMLYFASGRLDAAGAMLTASHNPSRYNGVKLCLAGARPIGQESGLAEIRAGTEEMLAGLGPHDAPWAGGAPPAAVEERDLLAEFAAHVRSFVDVGDLKPLRLVADTANGMGGLVAPAVFEGLPFEVEILFPELDGDFPNHPADPIQAENLRALQARVLEVRADAGLAFDGDADRVFLVDEQAQVLPGSLTTAIVADALLERDPGATILHNVICSKAVPEIVRERGGTPVRTRVGHSFIKAVMAETGALFGGEHSGHYYFRDNYRADSGIIAALVVLEVLCRAGVPMSELRRPYERYAGSGEINTEVPDPAAVVEEMASRVAARGAEVDRLDGLTADFGDWWFNLRPSNTEPLLRLNLEAPDDASCAGHVDEVVAEVREIADPRPEGGEG